MGRKAGGRPVPKPDLVLVMRGQPCLLVSSCRCSPLVHPLCGGGPWTLVSVSQLTGAPACPPHPNGAPSLCPTESWISCYSPGPQAQLLQHRPVANRPCFCFPGTITSPWGLAGNRSPLLPLPPPPVDQGEPRGQILAVPPGRCSHQAQPHQSYFQAN